MGEYEVLKYENKLPLVILRPAAIYGPQDKDLFPFFKFASHGVFPILAAGSDSTVQFLFVEDLVKLCNIIINRTKINDSVYFISEEKHYTWKEISNIFGDILNKKLLNIVFPGAAVNFAAFVSEIFMKLQGKPAVFNRQKVREIRQKHWAGDAAEISHEFNYVFTSLPVGAKITYDWYKKNNWL